MFNMKFLAIGSTLAILALGGCLLYIRYLHAEIETITLQSEQNKLQLSFCIKDHQLNKEVVHEYETNLDRLNDRVAALNGRLRDNQCIPIAPPAGNFDEKTKDRYASRNGIAAGALVKYAGECERTRQQLIGLQNYVAGFSE